MCHLFVGKKFSKKKSTLPLPFTLHLKTLTLAALKVVSNWAMQWQETSQGQFIRCKPIKQLHTHIFQRRRGKVPPRARLLPLFFCLGPFTALLPGKRQNSNLTPLQVISTQPGILLAPRLIRIYVYMIYEGMYKYYDEWATFL